MAIGISRGRCLVVKAYKETQRLAQAQKILCRGMIQAKKDGKKLCAAKNYQKQKRKVARIHEDITNIRLQV